MNRLIKIIAIIFFVYVISCKSSPDKTVDDFKKVNEELDKTNKLIDSSDRPVAALGKVDKIKADSIDLVLRNAAVFLASLKIQLDKADHEGERLDVAEKILVKTSKGDSLFHHMMNIYSLENEYLAFDDPKKKNIISTMEPYKNEWLTKHFKSIPTVSAQTLLSTFQNRCALVSHYIWVDIK